MMNPFGAAAGVFAVMLMSLTTGARAEVLGADLITPDFVDGVRGWLNSPVVAISLRAQNERHQGLDAARIEELDGQWRAERAAGDQPLIAATLSNPLSSYLTQVQAASGGLFTEIFVMDSKGLNVGQSAVTSDYWQGDEAKFKQTYLAGASAVFIDDAELHEASGTWRAQLNLSLMDAGKPVGAATVEINLTELARKSGVKE